MVCRLFIITLIIVVIAADTARSSAQIAALGPMQVFNNYPEDGPIGSEGHGIRGGWFTGRWYCAIITAGTIGEPISIPFAGSGRPIKDERVVAVTAIDSESDVKLCLRIEDGSQPKWDNASFHFRILAKDAFCLTVQDSEKPGRYNLLVVSLTDKRVVVEKPSSASLEYLLRALAVDSVSGRRSLEGSGAQTNVVGDGWGGLNRIDLYGDPKPNRFVGPGSRPGRLICCDVIGRGQFAISERDADPRGRQYWLLSESAIEPRSEVKRSTIDRLYFPRLLIAPVKTLVFAAKATDESLTLYSINHGRLRTLWNVPSGYSNIRLELSEDESHAAVELRDNANATKPNMMVSLNVETAQAAVFPMPQNVSTVSLLMGVTNQGSVSLQDGVGEFYLRRMDWPNPRQVSRLIQPPPRATKHREAAPDEPK